MKIGLANVGMTQPRGLLLEFLVAELRSFTKIWKKIQHHIEILTLTGRKSSNSYEVFLFCENVLSFGAAKKESLRGCVFDFSSPSSFQDFALDVQSSPINKNWLNSVRKIFANFILSRAHNLGNKSWLCPHQITQNICRWSCARIADKICIFLLWNFKFFISSDTLDFSIVCHAG